MNYNKFETETKESVEMVKIIVQVETEDLLLNMVEQELNEVVVSLHPHKVLCENRHG